LEDQRLSAGRHKQEGLYKTQKNYRNNDIKQPTLVVMLRNNYLFTCLLLAVKL